MDRLLFIAIAIVSTATCQDTMPSFSWEKVNSRQHYPMLKISFPDGSEDYAVLNIFNPIPLGDGERAEDVDNCIYEGYLMNEKDVYITMTGCVDSDNFQIQFRSQRLSDYMFKVINGQVQRVEPIFGKKFYNSDGSFGVYTDGAIEIPHTEAQEHQPSSAAVISPKGYTLKIKVRFDDAFKAKFGADSANAARRIMAFAQNYWKMSASLGTQIIFAIDANIVQISGKYAAETDLGKVAKFSTDKSFDDNVYLTFRNNQYGCVGMGYVGTVCNPISTVRSCLCEWLNDDMTAGHTVAHEIGHNMGMSHDFLDGDTSKKRYDSKGRVCTGQGGVMDYSQKTVDKWSTCSVEDFTKYFNSMSNYCLKAL